MNSKTWIPLVIAGVLALVAAKIGMDLVGRKKPAAPAVAQTVKVAVVSKDVAQGAALKDGDLTLAAVQPGGPTGTFASTSELVGRVTTVQLVKGQTISENLLAPQGTPPGLPSMVKAGMRAVTIEVNEFSGVAGLLQPGSHVDVVTTISAEKTDQTVAKMVAQNLLILAVNKQLHADSDPDPNGGGIRSVTLLVTPHDAEVLELTVHMGNPRLVLRGPNDTEIAGAAVVTVGDMRNNGHDSTAAATTQPTTNVAQMETPVVKQIKVEVIRSGVPTTQTLEVPVSKPLPVVHQEPNVADINSN